MSSQDVDALGQTLASLVALPIVLLGLVLAIPLALLYIAGYWKMFEKAGLPGWGALVPIYKYVCVLRLAGFSPWWLLAALIPPVNIVAAIVIFLLVPFRISKAFGQGAFTGLGMLFLPFFFAPLLGFGKYRFAGELDA